MGFCKLFVTTPQMRVRGRPHKSLLHVLLVVAALTGQTLRAAPPDTFDLPEPTPTAAPTPEAEGPVDEGNAPPAPVEPLDPPSPEPTDAGAESDNDTPEQPSSPADVIANPVVQPLPVAADDAGNGGNAPPTASATPTATAPAAGPPFETPSASVTQGGNDEIGSNAIEGADGEAAATLPGLSATIPEVTETVGSGNEPSPTISTGETHQAVWWLLGLIGAALFGFVGWMYTRRRTAPVAAIEKPSIAGASALTSIEDAKLALSLDILGATRSIMMLSVEFRLSVSNRSVRAVRNLAVIPQLDTAQRGSAEERGPAVAQGTGDTIRIERIGPHQSEVITGTVTLPVSAIRPILQGSKPLFVPLLHFQLQLDRLSPQTHSFVLGLPSAANATRLHPLALDDTPGGIPGLQTRKLEGQSR